ncbi:hypothetical protein ONZ45_g8920 [Pleurotus djamor]|nr:hypothetical protein ONZ45_g8920 [Pleurotus djamor]
MPFMESNPTLDGFINAHTGLANSQTLETWLGDPVFIKYGFLTLGWRLWVLREAKQVHLIEAFTRHPKYKAIGVSERVKVAHVDLKKESIPEKEAVDRAWDVGCLLRERARFYGFYPSSLEDPVFTTYGTLGLQGRMFALSVAGMDDLMKKFEQEERNADDDDDDWNKENINTNTEGEGAKGKKKSKAVKPKPRVRKTQVAKPKRSAKTTKKEEVEDEPPKKRTRRTVRD